MVSTMCTLLIKPPHQLSLARDLKGRRWVHSRLKEKEIEAYSRSVVKSTGLLKWFQRLNEKVVLEHLFEENLRVFQGAFEFN